MRVSLSLDRKLIFLVMIVSVVALTITGILGFTYSDQIVRERASEQLLGESAIRGQALRLLLESRMEQNAVLANDPMVRILVSEMNGASGAALGALREENRGDYLIQVQAFQELIGYSIGLEDVRVAGAGGDVYFALSGSGHGSAAGDPAFLAGLEGPHVGFEPGPGGKRMVVASPVPADGGGTAGVIVSKMRTAAMDGVLSSRSGLGETGEVYAVNAEHLMLSESRFVEDAVFRVAVDAPGVRECFEGGRDHQGAYADYRGAPVYGSSYCAADLGLVVLAEMDRAEVGGPIGDLQDRMVLTGMAITAGMGAAAFAVSKSLSRPLNRLRGAANELAGGNFAVRTNIRTSDEIGELSRAFDSMAQRLQESLTEIKEKEDVIRQQEEILLKFSQHSQNDCVGVVDMKDSTKISARLSEEEFTRMYETFLNFMARIIRGHGGEVVKSIGDALMFRFPDVAPGDPEAMANAVECCLSMLEAHGGLAAELAGRGLPPLDYKISATYGAVKVASSSTSRMSDIFGPTVNRCFKINSLCPKNSLVVGTNLHDALGGLGRYVFSELSVLELKEKYGYEIFEVRRGPRHPDGSP